MIEQAVGLDGAFETARGTMAETDHPTPPRAFLSYSWSGPEHEARVLDLATDLRVAGVDVVFDKWDLREGQEANAFMEQMVTDPTISKVIIVSDRQYEEKSNARQGGAGTEAQIISPRLYANADEGKFVLLVFEKDETGRARVPAYYTSRIFIDFTDPARATDSFEQLLRWLFDRPLHKKPAIGKRPAYLDAGEGRITLATSVAHRRALDAVRNSRPHAQAAVQEFLETFTVELSAFGLDHDADPASDAVIDNYRSFVPYRDEVIELFRAIARSAPDPRQGDVLHAFLERFLPFFHPIPNSGSFREMDFDNFRFFAHELLLHLCTIAIQDGRLDLYEALVGRPYYDPIRAAREGVALGGYGLFRHFDRILDHRNKALGLRRSSLQADMLQERSVGTGIRFEQLMQTDFVLYLRESVGSNEQYRNWFPMTLHLLPFRHGAFELFARARSARELDKALAILGLSDRVRLDALMASYADGSRKAPSLDGGWENLDVARLTGHAQLGEWP